MNDKAFNAGIVPLCRKYQTDCLSAYLIPMDYSMLIFVESTSMLINVRAISTPYLVHQLRYQADI